MLNLREYQTDAHDAVMREWGIAPWWDGERPTSKSTVCNLATSAGKTIIAAHLADTLVNKCQARVLFVADREELIQQPVKKFHQACGIMAGVHRAGEVASPHSDVVVASIQTLGRRLPPGRPFDYIIDDECHRNTEARAKIHAAYPEARTLGITATAFRKNMADLGKWWKTCAYEMGTFDLIDEGYITPIKVLTMPLEVDITAVLQRNGDYDQDQVSSALEPHYRAVARAIRTHAADRTILAFLPLIQSSKDFVQILTEEGLQAEHCDGGSPDRKGIVERFERREFQVLSNSQVFSTGVDFIRADCLLNLSPTRSRGEFRQRAGRIMRLLPGTIDPGGVTLPTAPERKAAIAGSAKPDCVAEGTLILTNRGIIPVERVTKSMSVWDGTCFTKHDGVVFKGEQETITYQGLTATSDHRAWTREGWKTLAECAAQQIAIAVTGNGRDPIREAEGYFTRTEEVGLLLEDAHGVRVMRRPGVEVQDYGAKWRGWLPPLFASSTRPEVAHAKNDGCAPAVRESESQAVSGLRRERDTVSFSYGLGGMPMDSGEPRAVPGTANRPDSKLGALRTGKSSMVKQDSESGPHSQAPDISEAAQFQVESSRDSIRRRDAKQNATQWDDRSADQGAVVAPIIQTKRRVWDILNCGQFHRFTANGLLVHNCLVLDLLWQTKALGLAGPASLIAQDEAEEEELREKIKKQRTPEELAELRAAVQRDREEKLRKAIEAAAKAAADRNERKATLRDARELMLELHASDLLNFEPAMKGEAGAPIRWHVEKLERVGFDASDLCAGQARKLVDEVEGRQGRGLAPIEAFAQLRAAGLAHPETVTLDDAIRTLGTSFPCTMGKKWHGKPLKDVPRTYWNWLWYDQEPPARKTRATLEARHPAVFRYLSKIVFPPAPDLLPTAR